MNARLICFGDYQVHPTQGLSRDGQGLHVTPKSLALLWELVQHPREVVTKDELFNQVWPHSVVTDAALSSCIRELRKALQDDARQPQYIETVHRVGFRFLRECAPDTPGKTTLPEPTKHKSGTGDRNLARLLEACDRAEAGQTQLMIVQGACAASNSVLTTDLFEVIQARESWTIGVGSASSIAGPVEAYQPVLQGIRSLCHGRDGVKSVADLRRHAPTCLAELVDLVDPQELQALRVRTAGVTPKRWQAELKAFFGALCQRNPLLLLLESMQWADDCTLDWLQGVADHYRCPMVVVVSRAESTASRTESASALAFEREGHARVQMIEVVPMSRGSSHGENAGHRPDSESEILEQTTAVGYPCDARLLAAGTGIPADEAETLLSRLVERGFLYRDLTKADGVNGHLFDFYHGPRDAHDPAHHERLSLSQRNHIHRRVARYLEAEAGEQKAPSIAVHFDLGLEPAEAMYWYLQAASLNARRGAHRIAQTNLEMAKRRLPILSGHDRLEWDARLTLASARVSEALHGIGCADAARLYTQAHDIQARLEIRPLRFDILWELWIHHLNCGPLRKGDAIVDDLAVLAKQLDSPELELAVVHARWSTALMLGDLDSVRRFTRRGLEACSKPASSGIAMTRGCTPPDAHLANHHAAVCAGFFRGWADGLQGRLEDARISLDAAITHARDVGHPYSLDVALVMAAAALAAAGEAETTRQYAEEADALAAEHGFGVLGGWARVYLGWALARMGGIEQGLVEMRDGLSVCSVSPHFLFRPFQLTLFAQALLHGGYVDEGLASINEAFRIAELTGDRLSWAEMHRLRGELALARSSDPDTREQARRDVQAALDFATRQKADLLAERARTALARL